MNEPNKQRASLYRFLSRLFQAEVDKNALAMLKAVHFSEKNRTDAAAELSAWLRAGQRYNAVMDSLSEQHLEDLAVDFARVFLGAGLGEAAAAFPYESVYTSPKGMIMQDAWSRMHEVLQNRALELITSSADLMEDHVSVELEYMAWLTETSKPEEQAAYLNLHLLNWVPRFCEDIAKYAQTEFYRAAAELVSAYLAYDTQLLKQLVNAESNSFRKKNRG